MSVRFSHYEVSYMINSCVLARCLFLLARSIDLPLFLSLSRSLARSLSPETGEQRILSLGLSDLPALTAGALSTRTVSLNTNKVPPLHLSGERGSEALAAGRHVHLSPPDCLKGGLLRSAGRCSQKSAP